MFTESVPGFMPSFSDISVTAEHIGSEQLKRDIDDEYKTIYDEILKALRVNFDQRQLGLDQSLPIFDDEKSPFKEPNSKLFTEITLKWSAQSLGIDDADDSAIECNEFDDCRAMKRIVFIMELFEEHFLRRFGNGSDDKEHDADPRFVDIFTRCLSNYNGIALLNDLEHIRDHKGTFPSMDCEHVDDDGKCIDTMMRQYRANGDDHTVESAFTEYMNGLNLRERNLLETAAKIHSFVCHERHDDHTLYDDEGVNVQSRGPAAGRRTEELKSKFVNEVQSEVIPKTEEMKRMEHLEEALRSNGLSDEECSRLMNELRVQCYDSDTIVIDLVDAEMDPFNLYAQSNLFPLLGRNPFLAKITKRHFGAKRNDDDALPKFEFGTWNKQLWHWPWYKNKPGYVGAPKHDSFKEECLNNRIYAMTLEQFSRSLLNALSLHQTTKARKMVALNRYGWNTQHDVLVSSPLSVSHIFALLMYCNLTDLQYRYKKFGCRESDVHKSFEDLKRWNREVAIWHCLLIEAVMFFGNKVGPKQVFYTGLNVKLAFQTFALRIHVPVSTTISVGVAHGFCGSEGLILKIKPAPSTTDTYFNVEWLSDFAHEKERLFVLAENMLIADIQYFSRSILQKNGRFLKAFFIMSSLLRGFFIFYLLGDDRKKQRRWFWFTRQTKALSVGLLIR